MTMDSSTSTRVWQTDADFKEFLKKYDTPTDPPTNGYILNRFFANKKSRNNILLNTLMLELSKLSNPVPWNVDDLDFKIFHLYAKYMSLRKKKFNNGKNCDKIVAFLAEDLKFYVPKPKKIQFNTEDTEQEILGPRSKSLCKHCQEKDKLNKELSLQIERLKVQINEVRRLYHVQVVNQKQKYMSERLKEQELKISNLKLKIWKLNKNLTEKRKIINKLNQKSEHIPENFQAATIKLLKKKLKAKKASLQKQKKEIEKLKIVTSQFSFQTDELI